MEEVEDIKPGQIWMHDIDLDYVKVLRISLYDGTVTLEQQGKFKRIFTANIKYLWSNFRLK